MSPVQQIIASLRPKEKVSILGILPDFASYDYFDDINDNEIKPSAISSSMEIYENDNQESLSEQLYKSIDGTTTRTHFNRIHNSINRTTTRTYFNRICFNHKFDVF
jgi:hypothetical protein